jgi:succinoglycan biosynthesis transport protein ExoP
MTEFLQFIRLLQRNKITLILVPLITVIVSYFLVQELPDTYKSHARIATGLVDKTDQVITQTKEEQDSEIARKFESLMQMMRLKKIVDQVSYRLILNDLRSVKDSTWRSPVRQLQEMSQADKARAVALITKKYKNREELFLSDPYERSLNTLIEDMGYDADALKDKLTIYRTGTGDYINLEYEAENQHLAAFVLNTLCQEFIVSNSSRIVENSKRTIDFLQSFLRQKQSALNQRMNSLRNFKIQNRVLNLQEMAKSIYGQMADFETRREVAEKDIVAYTAAINNIDNKFNPTDRKYYESTLISVNKDIVNSKQALKELNTRYILSNYDPKLKRSVDSLQNKLTEQIADASDKYIYNPMSAKQDLVTQKLNMEVSLDLAKNSVSSIQAELDRLNTKFDRLVPNEARIQEYETSIDIASKEYIEALQRYNDASLQFSFPVYLQLIEKAMPGEALASKKMVLVVLSGLISLTFCVFVFFILFYLDKSIRYPLQLANAVDKPVLGYLNKLESNSNISLSGMNSSEEKSLVLYKDLIRSIRYELDEEISDPKCIAVSSLTKNVGKTSFVLTLAWAFSKINKTVLIIDGSFGDPAITKLNPDAEHLDHFLVGDAVLKAAPGQISILGNTGGDSSLLEIADEKQIARKIQLLKTQFDVILIEADPLSYMNKAKEWINFADRVVAVFKAGHSMGQDDISKVQYLNSLGSKFSGWVLTNTESIPEQSGKIRKLEEA